MQPNTSPIERPRSAASTASTIGMRPLPPRPTSSEMAAAAQTAGPGTTQQATNLPDIRYLTYERRRNLAMGPLLQLTCGDAKFKIPYFLFRAASKHAPSVDTSDPANPKYTIVSIHPGPISYIIEWLQKVVTEQRAPHLTMIHDITKDLAVIRAGKMLGFDVYVQDVFNYYWRHFKKGKLTYSDIDVVLNLTMTKQDSFFV